MEGNEAMETQQSELTVVVGANQVCYTVVVGLVSLADLSVSDPTLNCLSQCLLYFLPLPLCNAVLNFLDKMLFHCSEFSLSIGK